jgi:hypothetical protein
MKGGNTSGDAAKALGVPYQGFDLRDGFDAVRNDLLAQLNAPAGSIFLHPPYAGMIRYSTNMWGDKPHAGDLSQTGENIDAFAEMLQAVMQNAYRALAPGGHYGVLLGNWRPGGRYHHLSHLVLSLAPGTLVDEIVKVQHNCTSWNRNFKERYVRQEHETLLVFRRDTDDAGASAFDAAADTLDRLTRLEQMTYRNLILAATRSREAYTLTELQMILRDHPRLAGNEHARAEVRRLLADERSFRQLTLGPTANAAPASRPAA